MHETIKDGISQGGVPNGFMPVFNWQLTGHDSGVSVMAIFEHLQQVVAMCITERSQAKVGVCPTFYTRRYWA